MSAKGATLSVAAALGALVTRSISRPLTRAVSMLRRVAAGDLTERLEVSTRDEIGTLAAALHETLARVQHATGPVTRHSRKPTPTPRPRTAPSYPVRHARDRAR